MKNFLLLLPLIFIFGCGGGIEPDYSVKTAGFSGTVTFTGTWPDSVKRTHIVVFKDPLNSEADFNIFNLRFVSWEIPFGTSVYHYSSLDSGYIPVGGLISAGEYSYVAVAQSTTEEVSFERPDWFVVGVYYANGDSSKPGKLIIPENTLVKNIDILCDFDNPPPQPPGGN